MLSISPISFGYKNNLRKQTGLTQTQSVSFAGTRVPKQATDSFATLFEKSIEWITKEKLTHMSNNFQAKLSLIAAKLQKNGVGYSLEHNEFSVKSVTSILSKMKRVPEKPIPDLIRGTLFIKNPYDLSTLKKVLNVMEKDFGYILAPHPNEQLAKQGIKDLEVRLNNGKLNVYNKDYEQVITNELHGVCKKPQESGYEDIQLRLIKADKKNAPVLHELLILFGPKYAEAKKLESSKVYDYLRELEHLSITKDDTTRASRRVKDLTSDVIEMMRGKVSQKLFRNAKSEEYGSATIVKDPIVFTKEQKILLNNYLSEIQDNLVRYYKTAGKSSKEADKQKFRTIREGLNTAVDFFNTVV